MKLNKLIEEIMTMMKTNRIIYEMLIENTGKHFLDSGGTDGRMWQKNQSKSIQDFENEPEERIEIDMERGEIYRTVSVYHFLSQLEQDKFCEIFNNKYVPADDWNGEVNGVSEAGYDFLEVNEFEVGYSFNTYNGDSDLSQILQGTYLERDGETYLLLQIHGGCDARGGYTDARLFLLPHGIIHEYMQEWRHSDEILADIEEGYLTEFYDYYSGEELNTDDVLRVLNIEV
jgi:hypothetical protein